MQGYLPILRGLPTTKAGHHFESTDRVEARDDLNMLYCVLLEVIMPRKWGFIHLSTPYGVGSVSHRSTLYYSSLRC